MSQPGTASGGLPARGFLFGVLVGGSVVAPAMIRAELPLITLLFVVVVPLLLSCAFVPNRKFRLVNLLVPVLIAEVVLGGRGLWLSLGFLSGRHLLLLSVLGAWALDAVAVPSPLAGRRFAAYILTVGVVAPIFWLVWSMNRGATLADAFSDLNFLFTLALYFPLTLWLRDGPPVTWIRDYVAGLLLVLTALFALGPLFSWLIGWDLGISGWFAGNITYFPLPNRFPRFSFNANVFFSVAIWLGLMMLLPSAGNWPWRSSRWGGILLLSTGSVALALTFGRALWLSFTVASLVVLSFVGTRMLTRRNLRRLALAAVAVVVVGVALMSRFSPEGYARFFTAFDPESRANKIRVEQSKELLAAWWQAPLLGNGFGVPLASGYVRGANPFLFELQYHSLLYKSGVLGLAMVLTVPFMALFILRHAVREALRFLSPSPAVTLLVAVSVGVLATSLAGIFNPYLTSIYFGFLAALMLAVYDFTRAGRRGRYHE